MKMTKKQQKEIADATAAQMLEDEYDRNDEAVLAGGGFNPETGKYEIPEQLNDED